MMNSRGANSPKLDLKLNLSPPRPNGGLELGSNNMVDISEYTSPMAMTHQSSWLACAQGDHQYDNKMRGIGSCLGGGLDEPTKVAANSMVLVGCPRCLMYVMLSDVSPKCPKCKSTVLLGFVNNGLHGANKS